MLVERCYDVDVVRSILTHPAIYDRIAEDGTLPREDYIPDMIGAAYVVGIVGADPIGVMIYHPVNGITWECHVQVLPEYRKEHADEFAQKALQWAWDMGVQKIVAQIPELYPNVRDFGLRHGFAVEGTNRKSYLKNGQIHDQWYLGITR
jgi:RimJ/RimL family protein N-acetyltransferase